MIQVYNPDYTHMFTGKHANQVQRLVNVNHVFPSYIELFCVAPLIGFLFERKAEKDRSDGAAKIQPTQMIGKADKIGLAFALIVINEKSDEPLQSKLDRIFRVERPYPDDLHLFECYLRGGIEYLDEIIVSDAVDNEEMAKNMLSLMSELEDRGLSVSKEKLVELSRTNY